ncbi:DUF3074 family protein [Schizosaccharomyces japonicus yFS275]|uniref:DUF3074 family protein n=1 Tax=Schizosaccharomyces japonicus (strain yFS275 / FY16936) TaxID=402676 RepID=B6K739_SCHJY|nr:DUF3074 family protein [Schizosaccharomyces japonicus yFS275]EEB09343.1 DUF3074 family protein [Schizosaccharomyces japonicus yFS275]
MRQDSFRSESIRPLSSAQVPKATDPSFVRWRETFVQNALTVIKSVPKWRSLGEENGIALYERAMDHADSWFARISKHTRSLNTFKKGLLFEHVQKETNYNPYVESVEQLDTIIEDEMEVWMYSYKTPWYCRDKVYKQLVISVVLDADSFMVLQAPVQYNGDTGLSAFSLREVLSAYESIDYVQRNPDSEEGGVLWTYAIRSSNNGFLSGFYGNSNVNKALVRQVKRFKDWINKAHPRKTSSG